MIPHTQPRGGSKQVRQARKMQGLMRRYRAGGDLRHAVNFAEGVLIGCIIVLLVWLMLG